MPVCLFWCVQTIWVKLSWIFDLPLLAGDPVLFGVDKFLAVGSRFCLILVLEENVDCLS